MVQDRRLVRDGHSTGFAQQKVPGCRLAFLPGPHPMSRLFTGDESPLDRRPRRLSARVHVELLVDVFDVEPYGSDAHA